MQESSNNTLFERVVHYDSPQPSPAVAARRMRFRSSVAPSPPTSHKSESTERLQQHGIGSSDDHRDTSSTVTSAAAVATARPTSTKKILEVQKPLCAYQTATPILHAGQIQAAGRKGRTGNISATESELSAHAQTAIIHP